MTYAVLHALWTERDSRYTYSHQTLTRAQINTVIAWRMAEAREVEGAERTKAVEQAAEWQPPTSKVRPPWLS